MAWTQLSETGTSWYCLATVYQKTQISHKTHESHRRYESQTEQVLPRRPRTRYRWRAGNEGLQRRHSANLWRGRSSHFQWRRTIETRVSYCKSSEVTRTRMLHQTKWYNVYSYSFSNLLDFLSTWNHNYCKIDVVVLDSNITSKHFNKFSGMKYLYIHMF